MATLTILIFLGVITFNPSFSQKVPTSDSSSKNVSNKSNEETQKTEVLGTEEPQSVIGLLFPCVIEKNSGGDRSETIGYDLKIDGYRFYTQFTEIIDKKVMKFETGYIEGCPDGCYWDDEKSCPDACKDSKNWHRVSWFESEDFIQPLGGGEYRNEGPYREGFDGDEAYYGSVHKEGTLYITNPRYLNLPKKTIELETFGSYSFVDEEGHSLNPYNSSIQVVKTAPVFRFTE